MKLTSLQEIASIIGAVTSSSLATSGVAVDSRLLRPGDLFFALPGEKADGHAFIGDAAAAGAVGAVVDRAYRGPDFGLPLLAVDDVLCALQTLAKEMLKARKSAVVGVTGSLGKTTTKEFIYTLLKKKFQTSSSPGNSNSQIGLPLAVINHTSGDDEMVILEMGMTQRGQISKLIEIAPPDVAVVTTVALVHAENFDSLEQIAEAKGEIFLHPKTKLGIYPLESSGVLAKCGTCQKQSFSTESPQADFSLKAVDHDLWITEKGRTAFMLPMLSVPGVHNRHNFLAAAAVARHFGLSWEEIKEAQSSLALPERRLQMVEKEGVLFVNDAYNASEQSMKAALDAFPEPKPGGRKIAFFGGIVELGKFSEGCHRAVGKYSLDKADKMFCFGTDCLPIFEEWKAAGHSVVWAQDRDELAVALKNELQPGDVVLLKGSRAKGVCKVLEVL
jgi:UDP-N-acetylmuramoyl-tripeptide--D-alanyl-D-alanine ligase